MKKLKIYLETTIFNYYFDKQYDAHKATIQLFKEIKQGKYEAYTSAYVVDELKKCYELKQTKMLSLIDKYNIDVLDSSDNAKKLMQIYIKKEMIPEKNKYDGLHIAIASINQLDVIVSLNFKHINRTKTKKMVDLINKNAGYNKGIAIVSPMEVIENEESN